MNIKHFLAFVMITLMSLQSIADTTTDFELSSGNANGGHGIMIDSKPYLLDLVESGVEQDPYYFSQHDSKRVNDILIHLKKQIPSLKDDKALEVLAKKFSEIESIAPLVGQILIYALRYYEFKIVSPDLVLLQNDYSVIDYGLDKVIQLAIRKGSSVFLNKKYWNDLDVNNRSALILHELVYAFSRLNPMLLFDRFDDQGRALFTEGEGQDPSSVRDFIGYIHSKDYEKRGENKFSIMLAGNYLESYTTRPRFQARAVFQKYNKAMFFDIRVFFRRAQYYPEIKLTQLNLTGQTTNSEIKDACEKNYQNARNFAISISKRTNDVPNFFYFYFKESYFHLNLKVENKPNKRLVLEDIPGYKIENFGDNDFNLEDILKKPTLKPEDCQLRIQKVRDRYFLSSSGFFGNFQKTH